MTLEELQEEYVKLQEENNKLKATNDDLTKLKEDSMEKIIKLQETNQQLFLKATATTIPDKTEDTLTIAEASKLL